MAHPLIAILRIRSMRRALLPYLVFNTTEWATWIAILVWAFDSGGARAAGLIAVVQLVPATLAAPFAAAIGDRMRRDHALSLGYALQAISMLAVGLALASDAAIPVVYVLAAAASTTIVFTRPVHHAIIPEIAEDPEQLTAGNAASSTVEGVAVFVGPLLTGVMLNAYGPGSVFLLFGVLSAGSALTTRTIPLRRVFWHDDNPGTAVRATIDGLGELRRDAGALLLTIVVGAQFVVVGVLDILVVVLGIDVLNMGPSGPGFLTSAVGVGGLVGAGATIVLIGRRRLSPAILGGMFLTGLPLAFVAVTTLPVTAWVLLAISGLGKAFVDVSGRTLLQRAVRADVLARIFGVQESLLMGGTAVGSAVAPMLVHLFGARGAFVATGALLPAVGLVAWTQTRKLDVHALQTGPGFALLQAIPMFAVLPLATLEQLSRDLTEVSARAGEEIIQEGQFGDQLFVVKTGTVSIIKQGAFVTTIHPGDYFGEIALLKDIPRTATVLADTDVTMYALERGPFLTAITGSSSAVEVADSEIERRQK